MLSPSERIVFILLVVVCGTMAFQGFSQIFKTVKSGADSNRSDNLIGRFSTALVDILLQKPISRARPMVGIFHSFIFFWVQFLSSGKCE